jgi:hypothetical protein
VDSFWSDTLRQPALDKDDKHNHTQRELFILCFWSPIFKAQLNIPQAHLRSWSHNRLWFSKGVLRELWRVEVEKDWDRTFKFEVEMGVSHKDHIYNVIAILQYVTSHNNTSIYLYHDDIHASSRLHSPCQKTCGGAECWPPRGFKKVMCYLFGGNWIFSCLGFT